MFIRDLFGQGLAVFVEFPDGDRLIVFVEAEFGGFEADASAYDLPLRRLHELHDGEGSDALATAGFADDADNLALRDFEGNAVDRFDDTRIGEEEGVQILDLEDVAGIFHFGFVGFGVYLLLLFLFVSSGNFHILARDLPEFRCG